MIKAFKVCNDAAVSEIVTIQNFKEFINREELDKNIKFNVYSNYASKKTKTDVEVFREALFDDLDCGRYLLNIFDFGFIQQM